MYCCFSQFALRSHRTSWHYQKPTHLRWLLDKFAGELIMPWINLVPRAFPSKNGWGGKRHVYFPLEFEFRGKSCVEWEHVGENGISCFLPCILLLYIEWIWNFRMAFLPHTNTVTLLEPYCGTITEPGLPVVVLSQSLGYMRFKTILRRINKDRRQSHA